LRISEQITHHGLQVDILVNNAGHGFKGPFAEVPIATHLSVLRLNVEAVLRMTSPSCRRWSSADTGAS
jgi:short-subunit dehydrogenase